MSVSAHLPIPEPRRDVPRPAPRALLTRQGEQSVRGEVARLRHQLEVEMMERLRDAREAGAPQENDEYLQIKEEEAVIASRLGQLEALLRAAEIVEEGEGGSDRAVIGSRIEVEDRASHRVRRHRLSGGFEPMEPGDISVNSPVGQALLGRKVGEHVAVELPGGRTTELVLRGIEPSPTARPARV
jgi:transcription elongation factor GreA